jgi:hypothetical protein
LKEQRQSHTEVSAPSNGPWKALTTHTLLSAHRHHLPSPLLTSTWSLLIGPSQFLPHSAWLAPFPQISSPTTIHVHGTSQSGLSLQPWRWRQHASPKRWLLPINLHSDLTQMIIIRIIKCLFSFICMIMPYLITT